MWIHLWFQSPMDRRPRQAQPALHGTSAAVGRAVPASGRVGTPASWCIGHIGCVVGKLQDVSEKGKHYGEFS